MTTLVSQVFAAVARDHGARPALLWSATSFTTFRELDAQSNQVARLLLAHGVGKNDVVCFALEKCALVYAAILGCLKIGAPYFVVDPSGPAARVRKMAAQCSPAVVMTVSGTATEPFGAAAILADADGTGRTLLAALDDTAVTVPWAIGESDPAYIMFTSGSTGAPKGVTISQHNLLCFIQWTQSQLGTRVDDIFSNLNPLYFDNSVFDVFASLFAGAALAPVTAAMLATPDRAVAHLEDVRCTVLFGVPSLFIYLQRLKLIDDGAFRSVRTLVFGGEGYPKPMLAKLFDSVGDRIELLNVYGPTECTCIASAHRISAADFVDPNGYASLGCVLPGFSSVIIDAGGRPCPPGEVGELCLGGARVGLGYFGDPDQSGRAFIQNPSHDRYFDRVYRTGDLVREEQDGALYFVGRADMQVKHQGYRIELGEVEHALAACDHVEEAVAVQLIREGTSRLVGVVATSSDVRGPEFKARLGGVLPSYMVPDSIVVLRALPKNANGKVDRAAIRDACARGELR